MRIDNTIFRLGVYLVTGIILLAASIQSPAAETKIKIILVGDSTVTDRSGWGLGFKQFLNDQTECINTSHGGESSLSFMRNGRWTNALALKGNYYLIQFGHNNEPGKPGRSTDMDTFVANMKQYVDDVRAIGAIPVLVTPLTRRQWDQNNPGKIKSSLAPYAEEVRKIATGQNVPLVDLQTRSIELCESLGPEKCLEFSPSKLEGGKQRYDSTHLNTKGSVMFARIVASELFKAVPALDSVLLPEPPPDDPILHNVAFDAVVSNDSTEKDRTLQAAIDLAPDDTNELYKILIEPGIYTGQFVVPQNKRHITMIGVSPENTILTYALNVTESNAETNLRFKGTGFIALGDDFRAENITFQNTSGDHGQALALRVDGDRAIFNHCRMLGWQDTLMINNGRQYFTNCYLEGRVDFIYGSATAVFDHCEIHSKNGGHITAANTPADHPFGFVFMNCKLTGDPMAWVNPTNTSGILQAKKPMADLGRPWRPFASVTYLNCEMGDHIKPDGWNNWGNVENEKTARYAEYDSTGPGANPEARFKWSKQLTQEEAEKITIKSVLSGGDGWNPTIP
jgi:pectinesterase